LERQDFVRQRGAAGGAKAVRQAQPQKAAPMPGKPSVKDAAPKMRQPDRQVREKLRDAQKFDRPKPAAQALKDARASEKKPRRPGDAKALRPGEHK
jgi:hypothetical protein